MLLGAGRGTRLAGLGLGVPKILVDVHGEPLLSLQLRYLAGQGVKRVVLNAHHQADQIEAFARQHTGKPELTVVREETLLGTAGGVRNALAMLGEDPIVVLYGDVLTAAELGPIVTAHRCRDEIAATITVYESATTEGKGTVETDSDGRILRFREKAPSGANVALINAGLYVVEPAFVAEMVAAGEVSDFGHNVFPRAIERGIALHAYVLDESVLDVGTPETLQQAQAASEGEHGRREFGSHTGS